MKILLVAVNAKYIHSNPAVYSLRAFAGEYEENVEIAEFTINHYEDYILGEIYRQKPDVAAFSCYIWNLPMVEQVIKDLPKILPDTDIWLGGPEVTYGSREFLSEHSQVKGILQGEGEETFRELVKTYVSQEGKTISDEELKNIPGLVFRKAEGGVRENSPRPLLDMDRIPFIYGDLTDFENRIIYYESSRGCPFSCSYCLSSIEKSVRFRSVEKVKKELQFFLDNGAAQVKFVDRTFNCSHSHSLAVWNYIKEQDNGVTNFHFEIAADLLNQEELELLRSMRPGLVQLEIGVQSTNRETIGEIDRVMDFEHLKIIVNEIQKGKNIHQHLDLIAGLPREDYHSFAASFNDVYGLRPQQLQLGFLKVLKGSKIYRSAEEYGLRYHQGPPYEVLKTNWISYGELLKLKLVEDMVEVYYNSGQFANTIQRLEGEFPHAFAMYLALGEYYQQQGLAGKSHSRMGRFYILRDFIGTVTEEERYQDLLLLDVYLRENSKSRPEWAEDLAKSRETRQEFYNNHQAMARYLPSYQDYTPRQKMTMTHLERFGHRVLTDGEPGEQWVLFDYRRRNPLNKEALTMDVTEAIKEKESEQMI